MTSTKQLAEDAERSRAQLAITLAELRARLTPQSLQQEAVRAITNSGPARFAAGLKKDAANSAVPIAMLAAGVLWAVSNKRSATTSQAAVGSLVSLLKLGDTLVTAAASLTRTVGAGVSTARAKGEALVETARQSRQTAVRVAVGVGSNGLGAAARIAARATTAVEVARPKGGAAAEAASNLTERLTRVMSTATRLASTDPVFIAGVGIAVAGIAAAAFGISRQSNTAAAAAELVNEAESEIGIAPAQPPEQETGSDARSATGTI